MQFFEKLKLNLKRLSNGKMKRVIETKKLKNDKLFLEIAWIWSKISCFMDRRSEEIYF